MPDITQPDNPFPSQSLNSEIAKKEASKLWQKEQEISSLMRQVWEHQQGPPISSSIQLEPDLLLKKDDENGWAIDDYSKPVYGYGSGNIKFFEGNWPGNALLNQMGTSHSTHSLFVSIHTDDLTMNQVKTIYDSGGSNKIAGLSPTLGTAYLFDSSGNYGKMVGLTKEMYVASREGEYLTFFGHYVAIGQMTDRDFELAGMILNTLEKRLKSHLPRS